MNRSQFGAHQQPFTFQGGGRREIGLRAVAAAVLYHDSTVERTASFESSTPSVSATPSRRQKPGPQKAWVSIDEV